MLEKFDPLLIAAPAPRSGTTLVQRLLCSSPDALIFGESVAHDLNLLVSIRQNKRMLLEGDDDWRARQFEEVLAGRVNDWIPDLLPGGDWVLERFDAALCAYFDAYAEQARRHGRRRWGTKLPAWPPAMLAQLMAAMPDARMIYVVRDLEATIRSARRVGMCPDEAAVRFFCQSWADHRRQVDASCPDERTLRIDLESLVADPGPVLDALSEFAGVAGIDASVLEHRINEYGRHYLEPAALSETERGVVAEFRQGWPERPPGALHDR